MGECTAARWVVVANYSGSEQAHCSRPVGLHRVEKTAREEHSANLDDIIDPQEDMLPQSIRTGHGKMPETVDEADRAQCGLRDIPGTDV